MGLFNGILTGQCTEILEYTDDKNIASCNLASIPLSPYVKRNEKNERDFDFEELGQVTRRAIRNLKQVIDRNYYPEDVPQIRYNNLRNRPIGIGVQDLAGCFALMDYAWDSKEAALLNEKIARVMYYHGMDENVRMAKLFGSYDTFEGSPASKGLFQFDLWTLEEMNRTVSTVTDDESANIRSILPTPDSEFDWQDLRIRMKRDGLYFSLLFAQMPTASTAQILKNNESIEPYTQLLYSRTVLSGQFIICVEHLVRDLEEIGLWNDQMLQHLFIHKGSIRDFPEDGLSGSTRFRLRQLKRKYTTAFELSQKVLANLYLARARYQCQSTSNNLFMERPTPTALNAYHLYMWKHGAKTGMYYLKQTARSDPLNLSLASIQTTKRKKEESVDNDCIACSS